MVILWQELQWDAVNLKRTIRKRQATAERIFDNGWTRITEEYFWPALAKGYLRFRTTVVIAQKFLREHTRAARVNGDRFCSRVLSV